MSSDFIAIKHLQGELKISHKKGDFGLTVTDREFVLQRPHLNIHVLLTDIVSIVPAQTPDSKARMRFENKRGERYEVVRMQSAIPHYRFHARQANMHNRSGIMVLKDVQLIIPVMDELLRTMAEHGGLHGI